MVGFNFWQFLAGIAIFIYAMRLIESSLKNLAGRSFKKFLQKHSKSRLKVTAASTLVTAMLQSSSVVLLMVLSFVGAGLMNLRGALAAVLGSNLGTTLDSWVIAMVGFKINFYDWSFPVLAFALAGLLLSSRNSRLAHITSFLIGFSFIFISLEWLKTCVDADMVTYLRGIHHYHYLTFIPLGFLITSVIQSSSATIAITLAALHSGAIPFDNAAAIVIGSELGTTLKFLLSSIHGITEKKRVAWGNFLINLLTVVIASIALKPLVFFIREGIGMKDALTALVLFQTLINLSMLILLFPFLGLLARLLERRIKPGESENHTKYIRQRIAATPGDSLELTEKEILHLIHRVITYNKTILGLEAKAETSWYQQFRELAGRSDPPEEQYRNIKIIQGKILEYVAEIPKEDLTEAESEKTGKLLNISRHILRAAKNLKDIHHNFEEFENSVNDDLIGLLGKVKLSNETFYFEYGFYLDDTEKSNSQIIQRLTSENRDRYEHNIAALIAFLKNGRLNELESSSFLNVYREIYSSNQALIRSLADLRDLEVEDA